MAAPSDSLANALRSLVRLPQISGLLDMDYKELYNYLQSEAILRLGLTSVWLHHLEVPLHSLAHAREGNKIKGIPYADLDDQIQQADGLYELLQGVPDDDGAIQVLQGGDKSALAETLLVTKMGDEDSGTTLITNFYSAFASVIGTLYTAYSWDELHWNMAVTCWLMVKVSRSPHEYDFPRMASTLMITIPDASDHQPRFFNLRTSFVGWAVHVRRDYTPLVSRKRSLYQRIRSLWRRDHIPFAHHPFPSANATSLAPPQADLTMASSSRPKWIARTLQRAGLHKAIGVDHQFGKVMQIYNAIKDRLREDADWWPTTMQHVRYFDVYEITQLHILSGNCAEDTAFQRIATLLNAPPSWLVDGSNFYLTTALIDAGHAIVEEARLKTRKPFNEEEPAWVRERIWQATSSFRTQAAVPMCLLCFLTLAFIRTELDPTNRFNYWELVDGAYRRIPSLDIWAVAHELNL
ncbi:hypothetical protein CALCODRAFT_507574 [Calocera cornea HHB12733]|uniref:Uncharacterized protein n=1 Tax=Calocera cornea HHB12733 TaxID=1353952 RepID=A0A165HJ57_9BASI|nr:hypothetical protein CALCODRAFT_507574 [Calocera cornea HHB12733]